MKYLKTFETEKTYKAKERLTVGKYVICKDNVLKKGDDGYDFIKNNIGKLEKIEFFDENGVPNDNQYCIRYENIPNEILYHFSEYYDRLSKTGCRWFNKSEIKYFSSNKKDLEIILAKDKYNL